MPMSDKTMTTLMIRERSMGSAGNSGRENRRIKVKRKDRQQHHHRASQRIEEELDSRIEPAVTAPHADQEIHRHEHHFPENVKEEEVQRKENADHACLQ